MTRCAPVDGLPTVKLAANGTPTITVPKTDAPTTLVVQPLITGTGPVVQSGQTITVHYTGEVWSTGKTFDSSWKRGETASFPIGQGSVIAGWDEGLVGQTVGLAGAARDPARQGLRRRGQGADQGHRHARLRGRHPRRHLTLRARDAERAGGNVIGPLGV